VADSLNAIRSRMGLEAIPKASINYGYWAPVVRRVTVGGQEILRMYYCIIIDNYIKSGKANTAANFDGSWTERAFIGMCESTDPAGAVWTDKGFVTTSSSDRGMNYSRSSLSDWNAYFYYNAIDPAYIVDPGGKHWLIHGSWHSGFALLEVNAITGKPINKLGEPYADSTSELTARYGVRIGTRNASSRWQGSEAPEIIYKDGYYYLFLAYDGLDVPYNTRVVRSANIEGPYLISPDATLPTVVETAIPLSRIHTDSISATDGWVYHIVPFFKRRIATNGSTCRRGDCLSMSEATHIPMPL
jgi:arabinan endo-1,5-alpha-L-arabinosidase